jgi:hypothetical protein
MSALRGQSGHFVLGLSISAFDQQRTNAKPNYRTAAKLLTSSFRSGKLHRSLAGTADAIQSINAARVDRVHRRRDDVALAAKGKL